MVSSSQEQDMVEQLLNESTGWETGLSVLQVTARALDKQKSLWAPWDGPLLLCTLAPDDLDTGTPFLSYPGDDYARATVFRVLPALTTTPANPAPG